MHFGSYKNYKIEESVFCENDFAYVFLETRHIVCNPKGYKAVVGWIDQQELPKEFKIKLKGILDE